MPVTSIPLPTTGGGGGGGGTSETDKATFSEGTTAYTPVGGVFNDTVGAPLTEDQGGAMRMTALRAVHSNLRNVSGDEIGVLADPLRIDPTGSTAQPASQSGNWSVRCQDGSGNALASSTSAPAGTEQALIVRNIPSGTQTVSGTVTASLSGPTSGGASAYKLISAATTNANNIKASAGQVYMITASSTASSPRYVKFYNKATSPTVGTDVPVYTFMIPNASNSAYGAGTNIPVPAIGLAFSTGISIAITGGVADSDTTAISANEVVLNVGYL